MPTSRPKPRRGARRPTKRGPGRPALGDAKRSRSVRIRVTPALEARVQTAATKAAMSVSDWGLGLFVAALSEVTDWTLARRWRLVADRLADALLGISDAPDMALEEYRALVKADPSI